MDFSAQSVWTLTKLFVRDPAQAARLVIAAQLPVNVSVLMIVLSGVASGMVAAISLALYGPQEFVLQLADGTEQVIQQASPMTTGVTSSVFGLALAYLIYWVGVRSGGQGSLPQVLSVIAAFQIAMTVLSIGTVLLDILLPFVGFFAAVAVIVLSVRGLGHSVREGHEFETMGRAVMVILGAVALMFFGLMVLATVFGFAMVGS